MFTEQFLLVDCAVFLLIAYSTDVYGPPVQALGAEQFVIVSLSVFNEYVFTFKRKR